MSMSVAVQQSLLPAAATLLISSAALAQSATFIPIPAPIPGDNIAVLGISPDGQTLVGMTGPAAQQHSAFRWSQTGGIEILWSGYARDASNNGIVVGATGLIGANTPGQAVRWSQATGPQMLGGREATAVSADGDVVVGGTTTLINDGGRAFRWTAQTGMVLLPLLPGGLGAFAHDVSGDGSIIVGFASSSRATSEAFRWTSSSGSVGLGGLPGASIIDSGATAISSSGNLVTGLAAGPTVLGEPFIWSGSGNLVGIGGPLVNVFAIPEGITADASVIVGSYYNGDFHAFIWTPKDGLLHMQDDLFTRFGLSLPGWTLNVASGMSDDGSRICGFGTDPTGIRQGYLIILENPTPPPCYPNCDQSPTPPFLNVADFACFLQRFASGDPYANCDNSTQPPILNIADFSCFLQKFAAGCP
jgi:probable HAF family extracellular repeat protein